MSDSGRITNAKDGTDRGQIYQRDATTHGGIVIGASGHQRKADGLVNARLGDLTFCPRCLPHLFHIASADPTVTDYDIPVPRQGDVTTCGAVLLSHAAPANSRLLMDALLDADKRPYNEKFQLVDRSGKPLPGIAYYIERADGLKFFGHTDDDGCCPRISSELPAELKAWFGNAALVKQFGAD